MSKVLVFVAALVVVSSTSAQTGRVGPSPTDFYSQTDGLSLSEIVKRSFESNSETKISQLEVNKAKARLIQAGLRPIPTLGVEQGSGRLVGSSGIGECSASVSIPLELYGQRNRRIEKMPRQFSRFVFRLMICNRSYWTNMIENENILSCEF